MKKNKTKNPLIKRVPRELKGDWSKYLLVSLFMIFVIGFISGMYVANESMLTAATENTKKSICEDGHFELLQKAKKGVFDSLSATIYEDFYYNLDEDKDGDGKKEGTIRIFQKNNEVNLASVLDGRLPENKNEIAIDRMHADNVGIKVGDTISAGGEKYEVSGLIAYVNYATLHEKSTDLMFDAITFDVAMVTKEGWERLNGTWRYDKRPADDVDEKEMSDDFLDDLYKEVITSGNQVEDYTPAYANPAITFATDDMGSDLAMGGVILDVLIVIIAFIFAVTISNTIKKESMTVGTLRASGYTKGELVRHYLAAPVIVTFVSAIIGNILGYTVFKELIVYMYYSNYSLPTYVTLWNPDAFIKTTIIPVVLMFVINLLVLMRMLRHTPMQFLRCDLKKNKRKKAMRLPRWNFLSRFRLRIIFQNIPNYLILFVGIAFISIMLAMAIGMPSTLQYYKDNTKDMMFADYQYVLKNYKDETGKEITTKNSDAEKFSMDSLLYKTDAMDEEVSIYGAEDTSKYISLPDAKNLKEKEVYISKPFSDKYDVAVGDTVTLNAKYEKKKYLFKVKGFFEHSQSIAVFMPIEQYRTVFDKDEDAFDGFFTNTKIKDVKKDYIATVITEREITKMSNQLDHTMGSYMLYFQFLCVVLSAVLIYLLTKIIIEKNEVAISMTKILGYTDGEIAKLYLLATTIVVIICAALSVLVGTLVMRSVWTVMLQSMSGWFTFIMGPLDYFKMFAFIFVGYLVVMLFDFRRIRKIPLDEALKRVE
mgnify:FL=1